MELRNKAKVALVNQYMISRQSNDIEGLMKLLDPNIHMTDSQGHHHHGLKEVKQFYEKHHVKLTVTVPPKLTDNGNSVTVEFTLIRPLIHYKVKGVFGFSFAGPLQPPKISSIIMTRHH